jgi:peptidoglycan/LPS O-acetylase OafA/YrhL
VDPTLSPGRGARRTLFDLLRLGAALAVLLSHSYALTGRHEPGIGSQSVGNIAVLVFFSISGYLIAQSWMREPRLVLFLAKRALRILPALLAVLVLSAVVLGPLVTGQSLGSYLGSTDTWRYITDNAVMHTAYDLPGVFASNPFPGTVNGSLWTLKHEVLCYLLVAALGVCGLLRGRSVATVALVGLVLLFALVGGHGPAFFDESMLERAFFVAALLQVWGDDRVPRRWPVAAVLLAAWVATASTAAGPWMATIAIPYATIVAAGALPAASERWMRGNDISYGVYLWAFPVQQVIASTWYGATPLGLSALALPITVALGLASWLLVEHPALRLKSHVTRRLRGAGARTATATGPPVPAVLDEAASASPAPARA